MKKLTLLVALSVLLTGLAANLATTADKPGNGPLKVFILAGQSNMVGAGAVKMNPKRNEGKGSLEYLVKDPKMADRVKHWVDPQGNWVVRDDVWIWYFDRKGGLSAGYGSNSGTIGPEFGFGHTVGDALDEQVLLIKVAWGGKSLAKDFRPPSSGGQVGPFYTELLDHVNSVLDEKRKRTCTIRPSLTGNRVTTNSSNHTNKRFHSCDSSYSWSTSLEPKQVR